MVWYVSSDPCGIICTITVTLAPPCSCPLTTTHSCCADQTTTLFLVSNFFMIKVTIGPVFGVSSIHSVLYTFISMLALYCKIKCELTDPGAIPKNTVCLSFDVACLLTFCRLAIQHPLVCSLQKQEPNVVSVSGFIQLPANMPASPVLQGEDGMRYRVRSNKCKRCNSVKPHTAHHCRTCARCTHSLNESFWPLPCLFLSVPSFSRGTRLIFTRF